VSAGDLFTKELWESVGQELHGDAKQWWSEHRVDLVEIAEDEIKDMLRALKDGDTVKAKQEIAIHWAIEDRPSWVAYRDGTTDNLRGIAMRRARIMAALLHLSERAARTLGTIARGVLGL